MSETTITSTITAIINGQTHQVHSVTVRPGENCHAASAVNALNAAQVGQAQMTTAQLSAILEAEGVDCG